MNGNRGLLLFLIFVLVLTALIFQRGDFVVLALPLLVYLAVGYLFAPILRPEEDAPKLKPDQADETTSQEIPNPAAIQIKLNRSLSAHNVLPGQSLELELVLTNEGAGFDELTLTGGLPQGVVAVQEEFGETLLSLSSGETARVKQVIQARRGEYEFPGIDIQVRETFGLFSVEQQLYAGAHLVVEPNGETLRAVPLHPPQTRGFAGPVNARTGGRGTDFFTVREYQPGDPLRHVNWKASSRAPRALYTNMFEQQRIADVGIILDAREHSGLRSMQGNLFEYSVRAAATLTGPILKAGNRLGLLVYGPGMESVFPGYGKVQQRRILRALSRAGAGHNYALESLAHLPTRFFPAGSQIILISSLQPEDPPQVAHLVSLGYGVLVISPDPLAFETPDATEADLAWRLARAERAFSLRRLERAGVHVLNWDVRQPLAPLLQAALRRR